VSNFIYERTKLGLVADFPSWECTCSFSRGNIISQFIQICLILKCTRDWSRIRTYAMSVTDYPADKPDLRHIDNPFLGFSQDIYPLYHPII